MKLQRGTATLALTWLLVQALATCTPVREPTHCDEDAECQPGFRCNTAKHQCTAAMGTNQRGTSVQSGCVRDADCETSGPCETVVCEGGLCIFTPVESGMPLAASDQLVNDCQRIECDGNGGTHTRSDDADLPASDGNPCHTRSCENGKITTTVMPDDSECNAGGVCQDGECSVCFDGADCTGVDHCNVMRVHCDGAKSSCEPTEEAISGKICGAGKVCSDGECTECRVGASCGDPDPCQVSRITSCSPRICDRSALTGTSCGRDASGIEQICNAGQCVYACDDGRCSQSMGNPCQRSIAVCAKPNADPTCTVMPVDDGTSCENNGICRQGDCVRSVLVNGDFSGGLKGWTLSGDAANFRVFQDDANDMRWTVSTSIDGTGGTAVGSVSQNFVVPNDAFALRFNVWGGQGTVQLRDASGAVLERVTGTEADDRRVPVSWDLSNRRGQMLTVAIQDDLATDARWSYVSSTGFDVIRAVPSALVNPDFSRELSGWEASGDGLNFNVYNDWNYGSPDLWQEEAYGRRVSVSSYVYRPGSPRLGSSAVGTLSQTFTVPADASALRFNLCGGNRGHAALYDGATQLYLKAAGNEDTLKVPVSWDLTPYRGKALRVQLVDEISTGTYGYIAFSSLDIITASNGP